jgi:hypothetical protein
VARPGAAFGWGPPVFVSGTVGEIVFDEVGVDSRGDAVAVWTQGPRFSSAPSVVVSVRRSESGPWSAPRVLWRPPKRLTVYDLSLNVTPAGFALIVFTAAPHTSAPAGTRTYAIAGNLARSSWTRPRLVRHGFSWAAAVSGPARATIVVRDLHGLFAIDGNLATNSWKKPERLPIAGPGPPGIDLAANMRGDAIVAWTRCPGGTRYPCKLNRPSSLLTSSRTNGGAWDDPQTLNRSEGEDFSCRSLGLDGQGNATLVWRSADRVSLLAARRRPGRRWSRATLAVSGESGLGCRSLRTAVATDEEGNTLALWLDLEPSTDNPGPGAVRWAAIAPEVALSSSLGSLIELGDWGQFVAEPTGAAALGWEKPEHLLHFIVGSVRTDSWHQIPTLRLPASSFGSSSAVAVDQAGNLTVLTELYLNKKNRLEAFSYHGGDAGSSH